MITHHMKRVAAAEQRVLRYSQAILLGCVFDRRRIHGHEWWYVTATKTGDRCRYGAWTDRASAVEWALLFLDVD